METTAAFDGLACTACDRTFPPTETHYRCPACDGLLRATYDYDAADVSAALSRESTGDGVVDQLLPYGGTPATDLRAGDTPLVECPTLSATLDVGSVSVKDEGRNPTGAVTDRGLAVAVGAALATDADTVALPTTGNGGQSAAAVAGRAGLTSESFVPSRCPFLNKAMVNVHGGDMTVVEGRYGDALEAYEGSAEEVEKAEAWTPVGPASPYRREGRKSLYLEVVRALGWNAPDALIVPTGHGIGLAAARAAVEALEETGLVTERPRLYGVQPAGCAPVVDAWATGESTVSPADTPDTIVGPLEVGDPAAGDLALDALDATGGDAVAVDDEAVLAAAVDAASDTGVEVGATGGVAVAGARELAESGAFESDDAVVLVNPVAGSKEADLLRSHLMSRGM